MKSISINVTPGDIMTMDQVVASIPLSTRHAVAKAALLDGLERMTRDQTYAKERLVAQHEARKAG